MCGIQLSRTTAHQPAANGLVERFHRTLKAAIMFHADQQWTEALPLVLVGIRTAFKEDLQASDLTRRELEPPYTGPYQVLSRREKTLQLLVRGKHVTVSADRDKPAYILQETDRGTSINPPAAATPTVGPPAITTQYPTRTTRSGRHIHLPARLKL
ncbi:uncharacterized protein LOC111866385 [Cryptotermes secundus]|uniref:uncharacterized protein LOC111866385 n=1 Tax=Cryptotermes secundus TaxID=105785 RepID=UPI000CD7D7A6|nr:uncharacterized protein LOC111866385 [Cryptotermes secundus]